MVPEVSEDSVRRILESVQAENAAKQAAQVQNTEQQAAAAPKTEESDAPEMAFKDISSNGPEPEEEPQAEEGMDIASGEQLPEAQAPKAEMCRLRKAPRTPAKKRQSLRSRRSPCR